MKHWIAAPAAILALSAASAAFAEKPVAQTSPGAKVLYICADTAATREAFAKEFGEVKFVTAADVRGARGSWATPRCITPQEHARLTKTTAT